MLNNCRNNEEYYISIMQEIKNLNEDFQNINKYKINLFGKYNIKHIINFFKKIVRIKKFRKQMKELVDKVNEYEYPQHSSSKLISSKPNYFSNERIAIYTCIMGNYDKLQNPMIFPNNCDYFAITDFDLPDDCKWTKLDISKFKDVIKNMTSIEKNRYFKMHPHLIFPDYDYSIYVDGNIQIMTDLTEYIYKIGYYSIAAHKHRQRKCVYKEADSVILLKKENPDILINHMKYIISSGIPKNYGLIECNVLVRKHNQEMCKNIMNEWWNEFIKYSKRDQISFMHVLYMNGIDVNEIGTLGNDVYKNYSFRITRHN